MPMVYPNTGPGFGTAALDALRDLRSASPQHGLKPNPARLTESNWDPINPSQQTPPSEVPGRPMDGLLHAMNGVQGRFKPALGPVQQGPSYEVRTGAIRAGNG